MLSFDNGALRETVGPVSSQLVVNNVDDMVTAVSRMRDDPGFWDGKAFRTQALKFTVQKMAGRYEELAFEALETGGW